MSTRRTQQRRMDSPEEPQGDVQDPSVSSTVRTTNMRQRIRDIRPDCVGLYYPIPNIVRAPQNDGSLSTSRALILVAIIFGSSLIALGLLYKQFPDLEEHEKQYLHLPWDLEDAKHLGLVLSRYKEKYFYEVLSGVFLIYIFFYFGVNLKLDEDILLWCCYNFAGRSLLQMLLESSSLQTFAIPGSIFLSILSGFLFPFYLALTLVCCCSAIGASLCFFLSNILGKKLVKRFFPERAAQWSVAVEKHKDNLLNYIIFLRVTPFLPNWFINMSAPVIGVPLVPFALGTFIGVAPPSFVAIQAGQTLHTLTSTSDAWSWTSVTVLTAFALVSLIPVFLKDKLKQKFE